MMTRMRFSEPDLAHLVARARAQTIVLWSGSDAPGTLGLTTVIAGSATFTPQDAARSASAHPTLPDGGWRVGGRAARADLPSWAATLNAVLLAAGRVAWDWLEADMSQPPRPLDPVAPLAFGEVLLPFIYAARQTLRGQVGAAYDLLDPATHRVLERSLLARLARLCHPALEVAYLAFRTPARLDLARLVASGDDPVHTLYHSFVMEMLWGELLPFFTREPLLAQQAALLTEGWVTTVAALLNNLARSREPGNCSVAACA